MTSQDGVFDDELTRDELEEIITAQESIRVDLSTRLHAMTQEATELWTVRHRLEARIAELEQQGGAADPAADAGSRSAGQDGDLAARLQAMTQEAAELWTVRHGLEAKLADLELRLQLAQGSAGEPGGAASVGRNGQDGGSASPRFEAAAELLSRVAAQRARLEERLRSDGAS